MSVREPQFAAKKEGRTAVLEVYDDIGPSWLGFIDVKSVAAGLKQVGEYDAIEVRINSVGGSAFEGIAIHNLLKQDKAEVTVRVDGVALSAASIIAMAGDRIVMPESALMMIHEPATIAWGDEGDLLKAAEMLEKVKQSAVSIYGGRAGKDEKAVRDWMAEETWFTGKEAVAAGLADKTVADASMSFAVVAPPQASERFRKAPEQFHRLVAMSANRPKPEVENVADQTPKPETPTPAPQPNPAPEPAPSPEPKPEQSVKQEPSPAAVLSQADVTAACAAAMSAERERAGKITAACSMAKRPELAQKFIDEGRSIDDVNAALLAQMCADNRPLGDDGGAGGGTGPQAKAADPDAAYKVEYAESKAVFEQAGVTEEQYVQSRRIDDGLATLTVGSAAKK